MPSAVGMEGVEAAGPEIQAVLEPLHHVILPQLGSADLGRLACTCRELRAAVYCAPPSSWQAAAAAALPQPISCGTWLDAQRLLSRCSTARRNIRSDQGYSVAQIAELERSVRSRGGVSDEELALEGQLLCPPAFSPDGSLVCVATTLTDDSRQSCVIGNDTILTVHQVHSGQTFRLGLSLGDLDSSCCAFTESGQELTFAFTGMHSSHQASVAAYDSEPWTRYEHCISWVVVRVTGDGLECLGRAPCHRVGPQHMHRRTCVQVCWAPGAAFLEIWNPADEMVTILALPQGNIVLHTSAIQMRYMDSCAACAWHAGGQKLALLDPECGLQAFDLINQVAISLVANSCPDAFAQATWQGDSLVAFQFDEKADLGAVSPFFDICRFLAPFVQPGHVENLYRCCFDLWPSPNGVLAIHAPLRAPLELVALNGGQEACKLSGGPPQSDSLELDEPAYRCFWSPDSRFVACYRAEVHEVASLCTFHDAATGARVLQHWLPAEVAETDDVHWAPDCCSVAIIATTHTGLKTQVYIIKFAPDL